MSEKQKCECCGKMRAKVMTIGSSLGSFTGCRSCALDWGITPEQWREAWMWRRQLEEWKNER